MENSKNSVNESVNKIKYMMEYNSSKTLTEQTVPASTNTQKKSEVSEHFVNSILKTLHKNLDYVKTLMTNSSAYYTYKGEDLGTILRSMYKTQFGYDIPFGQPLEIAKTEPIKGPTEPIKDPAEVVKQQAAKEGYKFVTGTANDPYKYGTLGSGIGELQQNMGLVSDSKWGPKTQAKIKELAPAFAGGFTNADLLKVIQAVRAKNPQGFPIAKASTPTKISSLAPQSQPSLSESSKKKLDEQTKPGEMLGKTAKATGIAAGGGALAGGIAAPIAGTALLSDAAGLGAIHLAGIMGYGGASMAAAGAIAGAAIAGAAALALTPLILWLIDKDKVRPKVEKLFKYVEDNKSKIDQVPRGLDDDTIWNLSDQLYTAMKRLGTREKDVYNAFNSLQTISDLSALITVFNSENGSLMKWLDKDFDMTKEWMQIYRPIRNLVRRFAQEMVEQGKEIQQQQGQQQGQQSGQPSATGGYRFVKGTNDDPYKYGTLGSGIAQVQQNLGFTGKDIDGKWGPKTQAKMTELAPEYIDGYTNDNLAKVIQSIRIKTNPPIQRPNTSKIKIPPVAPKIDTMKLAPLAAK
jgi:hypothetical protein